jgi:hypothetical protein
MILATLEKTEGGEKKKKKKQLPILKNKNKNIMMDCKF